MPDAVMRKSELPGIRVVDTGRLLDSSVYPTRSVALEPTPPLASGGDSTPAL